MTDQELIAYLKRQGLDKDVAAVDRIEELVKERDEWKDLYYAGFKDAASLNIHYAEIGYKAKTAEAKLAKALERSEQGWASAKAAVDRGMELERKLTKAVEALREIYEVTVDQKQIDMHVRGWVEVYTRSVLSELEGKE